MTLEGSRENSSEVIAVQTLALITYSQALRGNLIDLNLLSFQRD